jgi:hypothetical protein
MSVLSDATSSARAVGAGHANALLELAFLAHDAAHARSLEGAPLADREEVVERVGDLALDADEIVLHARAEVAILEAQERAQERAREALGGGVVQPAQVRRVGHPRRRVHHRRRRVRRRW